MCTEEEIIEAIEIEPGSIKHAAMIAGTKEERKTALKILKAMKNICIRENEELTGSKGSEREAQERDRQI